MAKKFFGKRTLAVLLALMLLVNQLGVGVYAVQNNTPALVQNFEDTYYKQDGTAGTDSDWEIHLSKTAAPTAQDNVYDITLTVQTKDTTMQLGGSTHGAVALVLDVSNSMKNRSSGCVVDGCGKDESAPVHHTYKEETFLFWTYCSDCHESEAAHAGNHAYQGNDKTHLQNLQEAVSVFLDKYAEGAADGEKRMVSVAVFGTDAVTIQSWIDVASKENRDAVKAKVNSLTTGDGAYMGSDYLCKGGTNMEAGLVLGRNLLNDTTALAGIPVTNQSLILFSDGAPTARVGNVNSTSTTKVTYGGNDTGSQTDEVDYDDISTILAGISAAKIAVKYNYNDINDVLKVPPFTRVLSSSASSLSVDLTGEAGKVITTKTNASTVTDPMGTGVSMISVSTGYDAAAKTWDLTKFTPTVANGITTYTITYQVEIDPAAVAADPSNPGYTVLTPANGATTLNYTVGTSDETVNADFNEPNIRGIRSFTVRYEYVGEFPAGAPALPAEATYKAGASVTVAAAPTLSNYTFSGWDRTDFTMPGEDVVIRGSWTENPKYDYSLTYNANFGTDPATKSDPENISGIYATSHNVTVDPNTFVRANYTFTGWNTKADGTGIAYKATDVITLTAENNTAVLYAQWEENPKYSYSLTYNANFGAPADTKEDTENVTGTYATSHNINVDANTFVRENYTFVGWNTKADGTGMPYSANDVITLTPEHSSAVLYAQWVENDKFSYSVIYNANFGTPADTKADAENVAGTYATSYDIGVDENSFDRPNHTFLGWSDSPNGEVVYQPGDNIHFVEGGSQMLYALWLEHPKYDYTVIYNGNGGTLSGGEIAYGDSQNVEKTYAVTHRVDVDANSFIRANYTFTGWNTDPDGNGTAYSAADVIGLTAENNTLTLYAQWTENPKYDYSVIYDANFGTDPEQRLDTENVTGIYDLVYAITADANTFVRTGYTFTGWNTDPDGNGTAYSAEDVIGLTAEDNTRTLYAQWEINAYEYTVVYMVRINGNAYELFTGTLPEGSPTGGTADFGTVIDKAYLDALGLSASLTDGEYTYSFNAIEGITVSEAGNVVTVYYTCIVEAPEDPTPDPVDPPEEIEIPDEDVPLDAQPQTGDPILIHAALAVASGIGLVVLQRKKDEEK